jgi:hypothetical protein
VTEEEMKICPGAKLVLKISVRTICFSGSESHTGGWLAAPLDPPELLVVPDDPVSPEPVPSDMPAVALLVLAVASVGVWVVVGVSVVGPAAVVDVSPLARPSSPHPRARAVTRVAAAR